MVENNWRALYKAAVLETDPVKLELRVRAVEDAIRARQSLDGEVSSEERAAMKDALDSLGVLEDRVEATQKINCPPSHARSPADSPEEGLRRMHSALVP